jgi:hypothetical protein
MNSGLATTVWIDPGGTTGWAVISVHPVALTSPEYSILDNIVHWSSGDWRDTENEMAHQAVKLAQQWEGAAFGVEDFILGQMNTNRDLLSPVRITAAIEYGLWRSRDTRPVFKQRAVEVMRTCSDERLRRWGLYGDEPKSREHSRDARRHCLYFLRRAAMMGGQAEALRRSAWPALFAGSRKRVAS